MFAPWMRASFQHACIVEMITIFGSRLRRIVKSSPKAALGIRNWTLGLTSVFFLILSDLSDSFIFYTLRI